MRVLAIFFETSRLEVLVHDSHPLLKQFSESYQAGSQKEESHKVETKSASRNTK